MNVWIIAGAILVAAIFWFFKRDINKAKIMAVEAQEAISALVAAFSPSGPGGKGLTPEELKTISEELFDVVEAFKSGD